MSQMLMSLAVLVDLRNPLLIRYSEESDPGCPHLDIPKRPSGIIGFVK